MAPTRERIGSIESLRALAALSILAFHAGLPAGITSGDSSLNTFVSQLSLGVSIFFLISGFLLYRPFVRARVLGTRPPWIARYAASRVLRIVPAYWVALAVITVWLGISGVFTLKGIPTYFGFLQVYRPGTIDGGLSQAWTLCDEVIFYAFLPLYALLMGRLPDGSGEKRLRSEWRGVAALLTFGLVWNVIMLHFHPPSHRASAPYLVSFPTFLDEFALGMGVAVLATAAEYRQLRGLPIGRRRPAVPLLVAALAFWVSATQVGALGSGQITSWEWIGRHLLFGVVALGLLLPAVFPRPDGGWVHAAMTTRPGRWLGEVSYGIYLWHGAVLLQLRNWGLGPPGPPVVRWLEWVALGTLGTVAIAAASWYGVERPALSLRDRVVPLAAEQVGRLRRFRRRPAPETAAEAETDIAAP